MANQQATKTAQPGERPFDDPTMPITTQLSPVFVFANETVLTVRRDKDDATPRAAFAQRITVVGEVADQARRFTARRASARARDLNGGQRRLDECDFRGTGRGDMYSQRNTLAVDHHHPLRTLAPLGFSDFRAPFLADANEPSMNVCSQRSRPRASSWPRKARHRRSHVPSSSHCRNRRQQVDPLGYPSGRSRQRAPVFSTQRIPSTTSRLLTRGRPPLRDRRGRGRCGSIFAHCASVSRMLRPRMRTSGHRSTEMQQKVQELICSVNGF